MTKKNLFGFTLVELAIFLIIIGLLLGAILRGQEVFIKAEARHLEEQVRDLTAAFMAFQDRYQALPGDYAQAHVNIHQAQVGGNGNGKIDTALEQMHAWQHLQAAGLIDLQLEVDQTMQDKQSSLDCHTTSCPSNGYGASFMISYSNKGQGGLHTRHELITGSGIPVAVLAALDARIDDGKAHSGTMRLARANQENSSQNGNNCFDASHPKGYNLLGASNNCTAIIRNF